MKTKCVTTTRDDLIALTMYHALLTLKHDSNVKRSGGLKTMDKEIVIDLIQIKISDYLGLLREIGIIETDDFLYLFAKSFKVVTEDYDNIMKQLY